MNEYCIIDVETGGLNYETDGLCTICLKKFSNDSKHLLIKLKPNKMLEFKKEAMDINRLNLEILEKEGLEEIDAIKEIITFLRNNFNYKPIVMGQNVQFDINFLKQLFKRNNLKYDDYFSYLYMDTKVIMLYLQDKGLLRENISLSLSSIYKLLFGEDELYRCAHEADADVLMTEKLYKYFLNMK
jgi:DNA polymerase III alpha subunit (gram-positive type)